MECRLHKQIPKIDKNGIEGALAIHSMEGKETTALFFQKERVLAELKKPDIIFINAHGILLKGYEPAGADRQHRQKFVYQEWFCAFTNSSRNHEKLVETIKYALGCGIMTETVCKKFEQALKEAENKNG